uniref:F5/8 type C domain-containing protein n=1 Tax=Panagrellus redivivus TaxID=6233 RepID=A0A7E4V021_PANRE
MSDPITPEAANMANKIGHLFLNEKKLHRVFEEEKFVTSKNKIFHRLVDWMKANPSDSKHFPGLLRFIDLRTMVIDDLVTAFWPLKLIDGNDLLDIVYEQMQKGDPLDPNNRAALGEQKAVVIRSHAINGNGAESIIIDLECIYLLNCLEMELSDGDWSYWIEVSDDNVNWTRIIDYSDYICRSVQRLYFKERAIRYIRIHGIAPTNVIFKISQLEAYYTKEPVSFDRKTKIVIPDENVALAENNAIVIQGYNSAGTLNAMLNGNTLDGSFTYHGIGKDPIIVQLPQPYLIDTMILCLNAKATCTYTIEVSTDKKKWKRVSREKTGNSWQHARFERQPVVFIKITGTYSTDLLLTCRHIDCHADTRP